MDERAKDQILKYLIQGIEYMLENDNQKAIHKIKVAKEILEWGMQPND